MKSTLRRAFAQSSVLRRLVIPILRRFDVLIRWRHDVTGRPFYVKSFSHKGYWYYGAVREPNELIRFEEIIEAGDTVLEVGAHIGYVTQVLEGLVGPEGKVYCAEPTQESLALLSRNVNESTIIFPVAISDRVGKTTFYTENFGGFTNSLVAEFTRQTNAGLRKTQGRAVSNVGEVEIFTTTLDRICQEHKITPDFLKIDVEGAELAVLRGGEKVLSALKGMMVEVSRDNDEVFALLLGAGFLAFDKLGNEIKTASRGGNIFFVRPGTFGSFT